MLFNSQRGKTQELQNILKSEQDAHVKTKRQLKIAISGLKRLCARTGAEVKEYYTDLTATVKLKPTLPSITTQRGRFVVPDL